jgi:geranylgeranyl pyrophosphate synthase
MDSFLLDLKKVELSINDRLKLIFDEKKFNNKNLLEQMSYSTIDGGKRFRPFLIYYVGKYFHIDEDILLDVGVAIELVHCYSLVHDDLPSMDNDDYRRGKLSSHKKYGEAVAILVGDALQSCAFNYLSSPKIKLSDSVKIKLIAELSHCIGAENLVLGQYLDIKFDKNNTLEDLKEINFYKTAKLISLCFKIVAIIADLTGEKTKLLTHWGENIGIIFQMLDDKADFKDDKPNIFNMMGEVDFNNNLNNLLDENKKLANQLDCKILNNISQYILNNFK